MKYVHYNENTNKILGYYSKDVHKKIPTPNIEITDEEWKEALAINANCVDVEAKTLFRKDFRTQEEIDEENTIKQNKEALKYLSDTDWLMQRHADQLALSIPTSLTNSEYLDILTKRQSYREKVI